MPVKTSLNSLILSETLQMQFLIVRKMHKLKRGEIKKVQIFAWILISPFLLVNFVHGTEHSGSIKSWITRKIYTVVIWMNCHIDFWFK
jgi:hypothetical protein